MNAHPLASHLTILCRVRFQYGRQISLNRANDLWCTDNKTPPVQGAERRHWLTAFNTVPSIMPRDGNGSYVYLYQSDGTPVVSELSQAPDPSNVFVAQAVPVGNGRRLPLLNGGS